MVDLKCNGSSAFLAIQTDFHQGTVIELSRVLQHITLFRKASLSSLPLQLMERDKLLPKEPDFYSTNLSSYVSLGNQSLSIDHYWRSASLREVIFFVTGLMIPVFPFEHQTGNLNTSKGCLLFSDHIFFWQTPPHSAPQQKETLNGNNETKPIWLHDLSYHLIINNFGVGYVDGLKNLEWAWIWLTTE